MTTTKPTATTNDQAERLDVKPEGNTHQDDLAELQQMIADCIECISKYQLLA
jgi:hypothetical protein